MLPFIILDRDGVINYDSDEYIKSPKEWVPIPGSLEAIARLNRSGYRVLVVTNQSGIGRGYYDLETLTRIHEKLFQELSAVGGHIDDIFFCPHLPEEACGCRKPKPGMLKMIETKYSIDLSKIFFIGDSQADIQAAKAAGCMPLLVLTGKGEKTRRQCPEFVDVQSFANLTAAVEYVLYKRPHDECSAT